MVASLVVMPVGAKELRQEIFTADYAHFDGVSLFSDSNGEQDLEATNTGLHLTATGFNASSDGDTYAGLPLDDTYDTLDIQLKWKKGSVENSEGELVKDISSENMFYLGLKSDSSGSYQALIGMDSNGTFLRVPGNSASAYQTPVQPLASGDYFNLEIKFYNESGKWYASFYDLNNNRNQIFFETFDQFTNGATGISFGIKRMGSEIDTGRLWTTALRDILVKYGDNTLVNSSLTKSTAINTINIKEGEFDLSQSEEGVTLTTTDYSSSTSKTDLMGIKLDGQDDIEAVFKWKKGYITDSDGNVISSLDRTVSSTYNLSLLSDRGDYIPVIDMDYKGNLVRRSGNAVTLYQNPKTAVLDDGFYNLKLRFSKNDTDGYWYAYFYDMNNSETEIFSERFEGFTNGVCGITFGVTRMGSEVSEGTIWKTTVKSITVDNFYNVSEGSASDLFFSADFAYPDCTEEFSIRNGTQNLEAKDDGLYLTAIGMNYSTDGSTFAMLPFDKAYNNLNLKFKWRNADVTDKSGNKDTSSPGDNKFVLYLRTDSGANVPLIAMLANGSFARMGGNSVTNYQSPSQPVLSGGFYNLELRFSKNAETGEWWAYFYDSNDDGKRIFSERFAGFTEGATGFGFGVVRMGSEVATGRIWKTAMSDLNITSGTTKVYQSPLTDTHLLDTINVREGNFAIEQSADGVTLKTTDFVTGSSKSEYMGFDFGKAYDNFETDFRWKKGSITDSSGNVLKNLDRTVSSTYNIGLISDNGEVIPAIAMDYMGNLARVAGNSVTLYQTPKAAVTDNDGFYNLRLKFGKNGSDGYWYCYFYDLNNSGVEIFREKFQGFSNGAEGITFGVNRMNTEVQEKTVWRNTLKNITIYSTDVTEDNIITDFGFTDGSGNPITIGYGADEVNVSFTVSEGIYGTYNLFVYLTGYNEAELKSVQRIPVTISEANAGERFTYTFGPSENDMVKKVYLFDNKLMPFMDEVPSLYLINSEENGENVKYVYANTSVNVTSIDYDNVQVCTQNGDICADVLDVYYYPEDELAMIEVDAYDGCPETVKVYGLGSTPVNGTAFQGYSETTFGTYIKGIRYDKTDKTISVQVINSSNETKDKYITVFRRHLDGSLEEISAKQVSIDPNSNNKLSIPYSEDILGGFYAILQ